jgi:hypothetical protein
MKEKKTYEAPEVTVHGNVETITQAGGLPNSDVPHGVGPTAFS